MALYRKLNRETRVRRSILSSLTKDVLKNGFVQTTEPVSYTHLTLPTILRV